MAVAKPADKIIADINGRAEDKDNLILSPQGDGFLPEAGHLKSQIGRIFEIK